MDHAVDDRSQPKADMTIRRVGRVLVIRCTRHNQQRELTKRTFDQLIRALCPSGASLKSIAYAADGTRLKKIEDMVCGDAA